MNGFGSDPRQDLVKRSALRMARPIKARDFDRFLTARETLTEQFGEAIVTDAMMMLFDYSADLISVDERAWWHDRLWDNLPEDLQKDVGAKSRDCIVQILTSEGFIPGSDFSQNADGDLILGGDALKAMVGTIPKEARKSFEKKTGLKVPKGEEEVEPFVHPMSEMRDFDTPDRGEDKLMNIWATASMIANVACGRGMQSTAAAFNIVVEMGVKSGKTEQEMKRIIRKAKTDAASIRQLVNLIHDSLHSTVKQAFDSDNK